MRTHSINRLFATTLSALVLWTTLFGSVAQAGMVGTASVQQQQQLQYSRTELHSLVASPELQQQMQAYGVDTDQIQARIANLTADELQQLNGQLETLPAGSGLVGLAVLILIVMIITDALGATDIFTFIHPA